MTGRPRGERRVRQVAILVLLMAVAASALYPLLYMALNALKSRGEFTTDQFGLPSAPSLDNFVLLGENANVYGALANSLFVVVSAVAIGTALAALAAFALALLRFPGSGPIFGAIFGFLLIPGQVLLIPIYLLFARLGLVGSHWSLIAVYVALSLPFGVFLLTSNFRAIPRELIESARIDGASLLRVFASIVVPLGRPAIVTLVVLNFLTLWNELLLALLLIPDETLRLLTPSLAGLVGKFVTNQPLLMSGLLISSIPAIIVLILCSRYVVRGINVGMGR